jgi:hypothetical protein
VFATIGSAHLENRESSNPGGQPCLTKY